MKREEEAREVRAEWRRRRRKLKEEFMALLDLSSRSPLQQKRMEELADMVDALEASRPGTSSTSSSALKEEEKEEEDEDELVSWDDVVVSGCGLGVWGAWHLPTPCWDSWVFGQWYVQSWFCWYCTSRCFLSFVAWAQDVRHHGRYWPGASRSTEILFFLGGDVICFRIRLFGLTVDTHSRQSAEAFCGSHFRNCRLSAVAVHRWSSIFLS